MSVCIVSQQVFNKLIRRYKYLEKGFEEEIKKVSFQSENKMLQEPDVELEAFLGVWVHFKGLI